MWHTFFSLWGRVGVIWLSGGSSSLSPLQLTLLVLNFICQSLDSSVLWNIHIRWVPQRLLETTLSVKPEKCIFYLNVSTVLSLRFPVQHNK